MTANRPLFYIVATVSILGASAQADAQSKEYRPLPIIGGGYKDRQLAANRWYVRGFSLAAQALPLAMYRGALLVKKAGYPYLQVVRTDLNMTYGFMVPTSQGAKIRIVGVRSMNEPLVCENKKLNINLCLSYSVEDVIDRAGVELGRTREQRISDLAAL
jgi:hypothetical protein